MLEEVEWNFEKSRVPDSEVVACCYWEYARESVFIRGVRERSLEHWMPLYGKGEWIDSPKNEELYRDLDKLQSIGYASEVFVRGISCPPNDVLPDAPPLKAGEVNPITGSFPKPWQSLTSAERHYRSHISTDVTRIPLLPLERGISSDARDILQWTESRRREIDAEHAAVRQKNPGKSEEALCRDGKLKFPTIPPSVYWVGGREVTVVHIQWGSFTDDEIANYLRKWIKANRPTRYPAPSHKGKKLNDWRVALQRLGIMRALHVLTLANNRFPGVFKDRGEKFCYAARTAAHAKFHSLFPFISPDEKPLSWRTRATQPR
ncbi:MAG: hypothetical protein H0U23_05720 [Blastocatellia bacterium]|nr:hypothetical protein [Blastocatellia bacterium]